MFDPTVYCSVCHEHKYEKDVEFIDISEDQFGADAVTFKCKKCGSIQKSNVYT